MKIKKPKKVKKITKASIKKNIRKLQNKALKLWSEAVKIKAGNTCCVQGCTVTERLNAHHIEAYATCKALRYDIRNGLCCCPGHHKFFGASCHRSFCFVLELLTLDDIEYLTAHRKDQVEFTIEYLQAKITELEGIINESRKPDAVSAAAGATERNKTSIAQESIS